MSVYIVILQVCLFSSHRYLTILSSLLSGRIDSSNTTRTLQSPCVPGFFSLLDTGVL